MFHVIRRYLIIWLVILLGVCILSIVRHWSEIVEICRNTFENMIYLYGVCGLMIGGIIYLIWNAFR